MKKYSTIFIMIFLLFSCNQNNNANENINNVNENINHVNENNLDNTNDNIWWEAEENNEISIDQLDLIFKDKKTIDYIDIGNYQSEISKWTNEAAFLLSFIKYEEIKNIDWFTLIKIIWQSDKSDIKYSFYTKWGQLYWAKKVLEYYNPAKSTGNPLKIDETYQACYSSLNNCSEDILFLFNFINKSIKK